MSTKREKIDELYEALTRLWSGGGECGVYTVAIEREKLRALLHDILGDKEQA